MWTVCGVHHFRNVYSGNEATRFTIYTTYVGNESPNCCGGRHGHLYRAIATVTGGYEGGTNDYRASKDCTIDELDLIASYQGKAEV